MTRLKLFAFAAIAGIFWTGCNQKSYSDGDKTYGSPKAIVEKQAGSGPYIKGDAMAYAPTVPQASDAEVLNIQIDVQHKKVKVADGVEFWAWTFGDEVPGPVLHVKVGQKVNFIMHNRSDETAELNLSMPHSIDFHAAMIDPHDKYRSINPGESIQFEWTANYPGVFMYHCGTPLILQHMIAGMYGMVIVSPQEGFPGEVDKEFALVQGEFYLKSEGDSIYTLDMDKAVLRQPQYVTFNGQYKKHVQDPLKVKAGDRVRLYVLNVGPNLPSSFHIVGTLFDKVWMDGNPDNELRGMQTVLLGSSNGAIVEFIAPEAGSYHFVDHNFASVEQGALGIIKAE